MTAHVQYKSHPAADIFPMMSGEQFEQFKADIAANGLQTWIELFNGQIIDGRNRYKACIEVGIEPSFCELEECPDPVAYVLSANLQRRHLTESQRSMCAGRAAQLKHGSNRFEHKSVETSIDVSTTTEAEAAELFKVSVPSVQRAKTVLRDAPLEVQQLVDAGELSVSAASKLTDVVPDKREQKKLAKQGVDAIKEAVKAAPRTPKKPKTKKSDAADIVLPESPTTSQVADVDVWLERQDERPVFERFKALWEASDVTQRALIRAFVLDAD